jgi:ribosomal small subunit protein bTHX
MGKGDQRSKRGKIIVGTHGKTRKRKIKASKTMKSPAVQK